MDEDVVPANSSMLVSDACTLGKWCRLPELVDLGETAHGALRVIAYVVYFSIFDSVRASQFGRGALLRRGCIPFLRRARRNSEADGRWGFYYRHIF